MITNKTSTIRRDKKLFSPNNNSHGDFAPIILDGVRLIKYVAVMTDSLQKNLGTFIVHISERATSKTYLFSILPRRFGEGYLGKMFDEEYLVQTRRTQRWCSNTPYAIVSSDHLHLKPILHICIKQLILVTHQMNPSHTIIAINKGDKVLHSIY
jgi:hypothetical protein